MQKLLAILILAVTILTVPSTVLAASANWQTRLIPYDVENGIVCTLDGCNMILSACDDAAAQTLRGVIREKMYKDGMTKDQLYAYLADTYGDQILAAPPKKGFNLIAWIMPFVGIIAGCAIVYLGLERFVKPSELAADEVIKPQIDPEDEAKLNERIKRYL